MISIADERLIPLRDAPKHLPLRPNGKKLHISVFYRWIKRGVKGILLESIRIGGTTYTSLEALQRFAGSLTNGIGQSSKEPQLSSTFAMRQKQISRATQDVRAQLGLSP